MNNYRICAQLCGLVFALVAAFATPASAQSAYPERPITLIIPFAAGGPSDVLGRHVADAMSKNLGQRIVVENVGGAGGTIGSSRGARATADGYTILLGHTGTHAANVGLYKKLPYDAEKDFESIGSVGDQPQFLVVKKSLPIRNFQELAAYLKATPATYGTAGVGSATHLGGLLVNAALGTNATPVAYKSSGPAMTDLIAGHIDFLIDVSSTALPQIRSGTVTPVAVLRTERVPSAPEVPGAKDLGLPSLDSSIWTVFLAPAGTPKPIVERLNHSLRTALEDSEVKGKLVQLGVEPPEASRMSPDGTRAYIASEIKRWLPIIQKSGVSLD
jgi:tripartite-type tricarboxylate transporter receptor subunit TctC